MTVLQSTLDNNGKKAVHVKWAGKTIALGTFPADEAEEKCARAKSLTRSWRSTMRPKPSREWVMLELERRGVRVVSGRQPQQQQQSGNIRSGEVDEQDADEAEATAIPLPSSSSSSSSSAPKLRHPGDPSAGVASGIAVSSMDRSNSLGMAGDIDLGSLVAARRNSSLGLSMVSDNRRSSLSSLSPMLALENVGTGGTDLSIPPYRPMVGGGAAAAYEAYRHYHNSQKQQQRRASSLGLGGLTSSDLAGLADSSNLNHHYEMLNLHHTNLLNELQETTLMMNLYQQQQLQQQQQQLLRQQQQQQQQVAAAAAVAVAVRGGGNAGVGSDVAYNLGRGGDLSALRTSISSLMNGLSGTLGSSSLRNSLGLGAGGINGLNIGTNLSNSLQQQQQQLQQLQTIHLEKTPADANLPEEPGNISETKKTDTTDTKKKGVDDVDLKSSSTTKRSIHDIVDETLHAVLNKRTKVAAGGHEEVAIAKGDNYDEDDDDDDSEGDDSDGDDSEGDDSDEDGGKGGHCGYGNGVGDGTTVAAARGENNVWI